MRGLDMNCCGELGCKVVFYKVAYKAPGYNVSPGALSKCADVIGLSKNK